MCSNTSVCINTLYTGSFVFNENSGRFIPSKRTTTGGDRPNLALNKDKCNAHALVFFQHQSIKYATNVRAGQTFYKKSTITVQW